MLVMLFYISFYILSHGKSCESNWLSFCNICQMMPYDCVTVWSNTARSCNHQSTCVPQLQPLSSAVLVLNVLNQSIEPCKILAPTQKSGFEPGTSGSTVQSINHHTTDLAPPYLMEIVLPVSHIPGRRMLRSSAHGDVIVPRTESVRLGPRGFFSAWPSLWNSFPTDLKATNLALNVLTKLRKHTCFEKLTILLSTIRWIYILDYAARRLRNGFSIRKRYWSDFYITLHYITA